MLALYGHPFSSYTWKALIPLYAYDIPFQFRMVDADHPENATFVQHASPQGKFPVLRDGRQTFFEATTIIEHLARHHGGGDMLVPIDPDAAIEIRMIDRVFDNYVMNVMQVTVNEYIRDSVNPDSDLVEQVRRQLERTYAWAETWLEGHPSDGRISLIECAAAPSLFYADWVHPIDEGQFPRLRAWRTHLLALPAIKRCVDDARPYRAFFPLGAPDRD